MCTFQVLTSQLNLNASIFNLALNPGVPLVPPFAFQLHLKLRISRVVIPGNHASI